MVHLIIVTIVVIHLLPVTDDPLSVNLWMTHGWGRYRDIDVLE